MKSFLLFICAALAACSAAQATDVTLSWVAPTQNTDGTPASIGGYNIYRSTTTTPPATPTVGGSTSLILPSTLTYTDKGLADGTYYYWVSAWYCSPCEVSALAGPVSITLVTAPKTPKAPASLTIKVTGSP